MTHLFINSSVAPVSTWREAFPDSREISAAFLGQETLAAGILWLRLPAQGVELLLRQVREASPAPLVVLSDQPCESQAAACLAAGASGYCNTHAAPAVLQQIAAVVAQGGLWLGTDLLQRLMGSAATLLARQQPRATGAEALDALTERELEVARLVAAGASNREIASRLGITERTVKAHLGTIFSKLQVRDRLQLSLKINGLWP